jgi:hypothetical protein
MLKYGMVGEIDDFARVVAWDLSVPGVTDSALEEEIQLFVPGFGLASTMVNNNLSCVGYVYRFSGSNKDHQIDAKKDWLVYFFESKKLKKVPVMEMCLLFKRAF